MFHLLMAEGYSPRFFGRSGEKDFGVDLLVADGRQTRLYQCKNLAEWRPSKLRQALADLAKGWLGHPPDLWDVPRPDVFVVCCPVELRKSQEGAWHELVKVFAEEYEVPVELWHRDTLDVKLRRQPDIVAELFSVRAAEVFCDLDDWNEDLFCPLMAGSGERRTVGRYLDLREADRLVVDEALAERFEEILSREMAVFVLGASGSGKTMTSLALADRFKGGSWRVYFVSLRHGMTADRLVQGIERRCTRPSLFVLDDGHLAFDVIERTLDRLEIREGPGKDPLVLIQIRLEPEYLLSIVGLFEELGFDFTLDRCKSVRPRALPAQPCGR